jgi:multisubunit Na+/H+ antiporter MnhB subunit
MTKRWKFFNLLWLTLFLILLSYLLGITTLGLAFLPVAFFFVWIFSRAKIEAPWLAWVIPYFLVMIFFLWIFSGGNPIHFFFYKFWISLDKWLSYPVKPLGMAIILFVISYVVIYLNSKMMMKKFNASIALMIIVAIIGIVAQFINPFVTAGMIILLLFSFILNSSYHDQFINRSIFRFVGIVALISLLIFFLGLAFKPSSPMESILNTILVSKTSPATATQSSLPKKTVVVPVAPLPPATSTKTQANPDLGAFYTIVIDATGVVVISVSAVIIFLMIKYRPKRKKKRDIKTAFFIIWMIASILFIFVSILYGFGLLNSGKVNLSSQPHQNSNSFQSGLTVIASKVTTPYKSPHEGSSLLSNPIFLGSVIMMAGAFAIFLIYYILKYGMPLGKKENEEDHTEATDFNFEKENYNFKGTPQKIVLFYYKLLRKKIGDPTLTPYEFSNELKERIGEENAGKITNIFVKLRYAHNEITSEEANFVKNYVLKILKNE